MCRSRSATILYVRLFSTNGFVVILISLRNHDSLSVLASPRVLLGSTTEKVSPIAPALKGNAYLSLAVDAKSKFTGKSFEIRPTGVAHATLRIPREWAPDLPAAGDRYPNMVEEHYSWTKVTTSVSNFLLGSPIIDHYGDMVSLPADSAHSMITDDVHFTHIDRDQSS